MKIIFLLLVSLGWQAKIYAHSVTFGAQVSDLEAKTQEVSAVLEMSKKSSVIVTVDRYTSSGDDVYRNTTGSHLYQGVDWDNFLSLTVGSDSNDYTYRTAMADFGRTFIDLVGYNLFTRVGFGFSFKKTEKSETDSSSSTATYVYNEDLTERKLTVGLTQDLTSRISLQFAYSFYSYKEESTIETTQSGVTSEETYESGLDRIEGDYSLRLSSMLSRKWYLSLSYNVAEYEGYSDKSVDYGLYLDFLGSRSYSLTASAVLNEFDVQEKTYGLSVTITNPKVLDF